MSPPFDRKCSLANDSDRIIQPTLDQVHFDLALLNMQVVTRSMLRGNHSRNDRSRIGQVGAHPGADGELIEVAEATDITQHEMAIAVEAKYLTLRMFRWLRGLSELMRAFDLGSDRGRALDAGSQFSE